MNPERRGIGSGFTYPRLPVPVGPINEIGASMLSNVTAIETFSNCKATPERILEAVDFWRQFPDRCAGIRSRWRVGEYDYVNSTTSVAIMAHEIVSRFLISACENGNDRRSMATSGVCCRRLMRDLSKLAFDVTHTDNAWTLEIGRWPDHSTIVGSGRFIWTFTSGVEPVRGFSDREMEAIDESEAILDRIVASTTNNPFTFSGEAINQASEATPVFAYAPPPEQASPTARALAMLIELGDEAKSVDQIAKLVGCGRSTLYDSNQFMAAWKARKGNVPRGAKEDGLLEAEE